jgi:hypothetical protein
MTDDIREDMEMLEFDYAKSTEAIYTDVAVFFLMKQRSLQYWQMMPGIFSNYTSTEHLPSWIINWTWHSQHETVRPLAGRNFKAGGTKTSEIILSEDRRTCNVLGALVGTVTRLGSHIREDVKQLQATFTPSSGSDFTNVLKTSSRLFRAVKHNPLACVRVKKNYPIKRLHGVRRIAGLPLYARVIRGWETLEV